MILYIFKSTLCLVLLLGVYQLFLSTEKTYHFNRFFLLFSLIFSLSIPLIPASFSFGFFEFTSSIEVPETAPAATSVQTPSTEHETFISGTNFSHGLTAVGLSVYVLVVFLLLMRFIHNILHILPKNSRYIFPAYGEAFLVFRDHEENPYSFWNYIFISRKNAEKKEILLHEYTHVRQKHTLDVLFIELLKIIFWFNPIFYVYKQFMQLNHEFLADQSVIRSTKKVREYQSLLLREIQAMHSSPLASAFHFSTTKKRFHMMTKPQSPARSAFKKMAAVTLMVASAAIFSTQPEVIAQEISAQNDAITIEVSDSEIIRLNGKEIHISFLERLLIDLKQEHGDSTVVSLNIKPKAYFGTVTDVQNILRNINLLHINFSTSHTMAQEISPEKAEFDRTLESFRRISSYYMDIPAREANREEIEQAYSRMMKHYSAFNEATKNYYERIEEETPPPPPLPPAPGDRLLPPPPPPVPNNG